MTASQRTFSALVVLLLAIFSFSSLLSIVNSNQTAIYLQTALWIWIIMWLFIAFLYDLHFKNRGALQRARARHERVAQSATRTVKIWTDAFYERFEHLLMWKYYKQALHCLLMPGFIFWASVIIFYLELGHFRDQYTVATLSVFALTANFVYIKEVFSRKKERVDSDVFVIWSVVKIYTTALLFSAALGLMRSFCLEPRLFALAVFSLCFLLMYQGLYQHRLVNTATIFTTTILSAVLAVAGYYIYIFWNYNYFSAAVFFAALYNLLWGSFHYYLDRALTKKVLIEIVLICLLIAYMILSTTNFQAKISDACSFNSISTQAK